jgi:hypothetical protein
MKTRLLKLTAVLLIAAGAFACTEKEQESENTPVEFTEYSLAETGCQWTNLEYEGILSIINSQVDFERYFDCAAGVCPEIDFSKHTLLLASGQSMNGIGKIETVLLKNTSKKYILKVTVHMGITANVENWAVSIITPKISDKPEIKFDIEYTHF